MKLKAGDVVVLKSGGQALTVADVTDESVECVWIGEEGLRPVTPPSSTFSKDVMPEF